MNPARGIAFKLISAALFAVMQALVRYLAAHSPTERAELQTADIARRLMRGGELHQDTTA